MNKKQGFTLVELMIVLALLGILGGLIAAGYSGYRNNTKDYTAERMLDVLEEAYLYARTVTKSDAAAVLEVPRLVVGELQLDQNYTVEPKGESYTISYTTDYITETGEHTKKTYWRNGTQSPPIEPPTVEGGDDVVVTVTGNVLEDMRNLLKDMNEINQKYSNNAERNRAKKKYFADRGYEVPNQSYSNDIFREYLFQVVYNGTWPKLPDAFFTKNGMEIPKEPLYVQPYIEAGANNKTYDPSKVVVFARTDNSANGGWFTLYLYLDDIWFYNKQGTVVTKGYDDLKAEIMKADSGWNKLEGGQLQKGAMS